MGRKSILSKINLVLVILIIAQTLVFTVVAILQSQNVVFRLIATFTGLGIIITPLLLRGILSFENPVKQWVLLLNLIFYIFQLLSPWYRWNFVIGYQLLINYPLEVAAANSALPFSASILGFAFMAFYSFFQMVDNVEGKIGVIIMRIMRVLTGVFFLGVGLYVAYPILFILIPAVRDISCLSIKSDRLFILVGRTAGNPIEWMIKLIIFTASSFWFYKRWLFDGDL